MSIPTRMRASRHPVLEHLRLLPAVLLLLALGASAVHHHVQDETGRGCAVCAFGHAPGAPTTATTTVAPARHVERVRAVPAPAPDARFAPAPSSRAPPSA
jgi:hypothetical protein